MIRVELGGDMIGASLERGIQPVVLRAAVDGVTSQAREQERDAGESPVPERQLEAERDPTGPTGGNVCDQEWRST